MVNQIYPPELQLNKANISDTEAPFLDLHLSVTNGFVHYKRRRCGNRRNRPCKTREKSKSITSMFVDVNYTFKHSSFRNRLKFQAASIVMHVVRPQSYLG